MFKKLVIVHFNYFWNFRVFSNQKISEVAKVNNNQKIYPVVLLLCHYLFFSPLFFSIYNNLFFGTSHVTESSDDFEVK
jgi:hypothetical protein